jgi:hypothetical protein
MVLSFSFLELGQFALSNGSGWLTPVVLRDNMMNKVARCESLSFPTDSPN